MIGVQLPTLSSLRETPLKVPAYKVEGVVGSIAKVHSGGRHRINGERNSVAPTGQARVDRCPIAASIAAFERAAADGGRVYGRWRDRVDRQRADETAIGPAEAGPHDALCEGCARTAHAGQNR
jgi:hypothetical protein